MANVYRKRITAADGDHIISDMSNEYSIGQVFVAFYNGDTMVTPSAGSVTIRAGLFDGQYLAASSGGYILAADAGVGDVAYQPAVFDGPVSHVKATLAGIVGADAVEIAVWRDE